LPRLAGSRIPWLRTYAAAAARELNDTSSLRRLTRDRDPNVQEAAIDGLSKVAGHAGDQQFIGALTSKGYQAVRAAARALKGSPGGSEAIGPLIAAERRLRRDSSETSRDARVAVMERIGEFATRANVTEVAGLSNDFDCEVEGAAAAISRRLTAGITLQSAGCTPLAIKLPPDAVALALGRVVRLRVTLADSSGGGSFTVRLRGDVAPIMAARILALARSGYYNGLVWQRVEPDFVIQGGGLGANEYVGNPRFIRDELGTVPHVRGTVGMSTRGHDTGDGQWFVNLRDNLRLNADYTVFGEIVDGIDVVDGVQQGDVIARIDVMG
jgi:cyclophilin family peptidyl-prolyl cis-trans isomerase